MATSADTTASRTVSLGAVADLARAGGEGASSPFARVRFEIHQHLDRPGIYRELLTRESASPLGPFDFTETITFAANGVGLVIGTKLDPESTSIGTGHGSQAQVYLARDESNSRVYAGEAQPNPSFLYETSTVLEGLVSLDPEPLALGARHAIAVRSLALEVARTAALVAKAPILSLQFPVQPSAHRYTGDGSAEARSAQWPRSSALCLRFSIAIGDQSTSRERFNLLSRLASFCEHRGYGFWVSDSRPGHRSGNWFQVCAHDKDLARSSVFLDSPYPGEHSQWVLPITLMGPARVGSTQATLEVIERLDGVGISGLSITSLDDLAFIHLQLHLPVDRKSDYTGLVNRLRSVPFPPSSPSSAAMNDVLEAIGLKSLWPGDATETYFNDRTAGYSLLPGPPLRRALEHKVVRRPVWFSWEMDDGAAGLRSPLLAMYAAIDRILEARGVQRNESEQGSALYPNIEYLISRDVGGGSYRAKGKLAVPATLIRRLYPNLKSDEVPVALVVALEEAWLSAMGDLARPPRELTVAWREHWLGRWSSLAG